MDCNTSSPGKGRTRSLLQNKKGILRSMGLNCRSQPCLKDALDIRS
ncbi:hypothetical protein CLOM621_06850 [Clostridium sp. M62/1]|nr:hypothetical protein CLOM621_06850 [Clostridium sp. M62/1]CBK75980.1 hypothetical protein CLS_00880 [[Clostridium] cf. saccharolyticum K10]